jgi:hypothetical protein
VLRADFIFHATLKADDGANSATNNEDVKQLNLVIVNVVTLEGRYRAAYPYVRVFWTQRVGAEDIGSLSCNLNNRCNGFSQRKKEYHDPCSLLGLAIVL